MSLNVKDPEVYRLAQAIAKVTGQTMTRAVKEALREHFERLQTPRGKASVEELLAIAKSASAEVKGRYLDHAEFLYDERGLTK
jgi:antitoxin VapB